MQLFLSLIIRVVSDGLYVVNETVKDFLYGLESFLGGNLSLYHYVNEDPYSEKQDLQLVRSFRDKVQTSFSIYESVISIIDKDFVRRKVILYTNNGKITSFKIDYTKVYSIGQNKLHDLWSVDANLVSFHYKGSELDSMIIYESACKTGINSLPALANVLLEINEMSKHTKQKKIPPQIIDYYKVINDLTAFDLEYKEP